MFDIDFFEVVKRMIKYLVQGLAVGFSMMIIQKNVKISEAVLVGLVAAAVFSILDIYSPSVSSGTKLGAGFALGSRMVGGL